MKIIIGPSFLELNSDDFHFFKSLFSSSRSRDRILEEKKHPFLDSLWLVYPNSTKTFEDLYSLTRLEKVPGPFIRELYFHKMDVQCIALHCNDRNVSFDSPKEKTDHIALYFIIINTELT